MRTTTFLLYLALSLAASAGGSKDAAQPAADKANPGDWCEWLSGDPGLLYDNGENPWIDKVLISGRFHYQAGRVSGNDVRGNSFSESFDEYRRARIEAQVGFLRYFDIEVGVNMVDDRRYRAQAPNDLDWGYDTFDSAVLSFNIGKAFGSGPLDDIKLHYGRMKLRVSEEVHTSANRIKTIERSLLADKLGGEQSRPTGALLELVKGPWELDLGIYSGEDDSEFVGAWNDGEIFYASIAWQATVELRFLLDHVQNHQSGHDDALGYAQATSLAAIYEREKWGLMLNLMTGDNGGTGNGAAIPDRQGDFHGAIVMPWYWIVKERLQIVARYQYARAEEKEGLRLDSRYIRAQHTPPNPDFDNGYGDENHSVYLGLNYFLCGDNAKIMGGVSYDNMSARTDSVEAVTYLIAFRTSF